MADAFGISATFRLTWRYRTYGICDEYFKLKIVAILFDFYVKKISMTIRGGFFRCFAQFVEQLPIWIINFSDPIDKARHDKMVGPVEQMFTLHKQLALAKTPDDKTRIQRQIDATDQQIDNLVYELYGLTEKEIKIVEEGI
jgi:hypothetical protein